MPKKTQTPTLKPVVPDPPVFDTLYTLPQVAKILRISPKSFRELILKADFPLKVTCNVTGNQRGRRISATHLRAYLDSCMISHDLPGQAKAS